MDIIRLLPDSVANQIAAGEVIQRPASVVKELVENAVDAGATDIKIYIKDAGRTLIQVIDNGRGMSETDARMAFERHATSKIRQAEDLFSLHTMGFRGEALPSICAVSQVELRSATEDGGVGTRLVINGSQVESQDPCVCEKGTNISVRNLFYNFPARRKFLKSQNVELSNIMREFERLALVNNDRRMLIDTGTRTIDLPKATFKQRIQDIWKNNLNMQIVPVEVETSLVKIEGFVSRPEYARRRNPLQFLIVNGRNMRHPYFHKAIVSCYDNLIATDTQPCYFLKFTVDPETIDVNIHPTKNEIKFEFEQQIWPILAAAVKAALGRHAAVPSIDFDLDVIPVAPIREGEEPEEPGAGLSPDYNPFASEQGNGQRDWSPFPGSTDRFIAGSGKINDQSSEDDSRSPVGAAWRPTRVDRNWEALYEDFMKRSGEELKERKENSDSSKGVLPELEEKENREVGNMCLQLMLKYIVTPSREGLMIIDQHRAHLKILFEQCMKSVRSMEQLTQRVLFPESVTLDPAHQAAFAGVEDELARIGFLLEYDQEDRWRIVGVPAMLKGSDPADVVLRVLDSVCEDGANYGKEGSASDNMIERMALILARSSAIVRGRRLLQEEMENLVGELFALPDPLYTPSGNRIYALLDENSIINLLP